MAAPRKFTGTDLVLASHNRGKLREIDELLSPFGVRTRSVADLGLPVPEEDGDSYIANAEIKALAAARATGAIALADDSGLSVDALGGAPGIYSARWAEDGDFSKAMERVWREVQQAGGTDLKCHFVSALTLAWPDGHCESVEGYAHGTLVWPPRGTNGFGYDPMVFVASEGLTFGEMAPARKHDISHRADAFRQLIDRCFR
ncbi:MAG: non-canonical purine NTP pyrophosphatase [Alphaproteobacteria bacterium]|jgi:XTP/dITP diphosphohydrolase|nr:non-canonical purine NTP pyrophosphatase [Alphaproteobacteria bacterium]